MFDQSCSTEKFHTKGCVNHHRHHRANKAHPNKKSVTLTNINNQNHRPSQSQKEEEKKGKILNRSKNSISVDKMLRPKRLYDKAFEQRNLNGIQEGDFHVENSVYKVLKRNDKSKDYFVVKSAQNSTFDYGEGIIRETSTSATYFDNEEKITKTEMIKLFRNLSIHDIWFAVYFKQDTTNNWQEELVTKIKRMPKNDAIKYVKEDFTTFGKITRELAGQKILPTSDNNYYTVRDLKIFFEELDKGCGAETAAKNSIRKLDVNTLQSLIFNSVKYILK